MAVFEDYTPKKLGLVFFAVFWVPMLVLHELGHAFMAKWLGWRVRKIVIGFGRELWRFRRGETEVVVKSAPIEGYVLPTPVDGRKLRLKSMLVYAAGPGAEFLLLAIMLFVFGWNGVFGDSNDIGQIVLKSLAIVIIVGGGFNLLPFRVGNGVSDGLGILSSPFMSDQAIENRLLAADFQEAEELAQRGDTAAGLELVQNRLSRFPKNPWLQLARAAALSADGKDDAARESAAAKVAEQGLDEAERRAWLLLQADIELNSADPSYFLVDHALQQVAASTPAASDLLATKGASFILRGRNEEGGNMLADAWRRNDGSADDATMLMYLATAAHRVGDTDARGRFIGAFVQVNKSKLLEDRLRRLMPSVRPSPPS